MTTSGLHRLPSDELKRLLRALHRKALPSPVTRSGLIEKGFGNIEGNLDNVVGRDVESAKAMLAAVLAERSVVGGGAKVDLAYCGQANPGTRSRDLIEQVRELLTSAVQSVEVYGLGVAEERGLVRTVAAVCDGRDLPGRLVFDTDGSEASLAAVRELVRRNFRRLEKIEVWSNPLGIRLSLRALIVDRLRALVTSGELHGTEDDGRIDLGFLVHDSAYIASWHKEWELLTRSDAGPKALVRVNLD